MESKRVGVSANVKLTRPKTRPAKAIVCAICELEVSSDHVYVVYPCKKQHIFHLACLYTKEDIRDCLDVCPACSDPTTNRCTIEEKHVCLIHAYEGVKRTLNVGRKLQSVLTDIRVDMIQEIAKKRYTQRVREMEALVEHTDEQPGGYFSKFFSRRKKPISSEFQDIGYSGNVKDLIGKKENIALMTLKKINWSSIVQENIDVDMFFANGYIILDCFVLGASWDDLISSGLRYHTFVDHPKSVDICSIVEYYGVTFYQLYTDLCEYNMDNMADIGLTYQILTEMGFNSKSLLKRNISPVIISTSRLWNSLTESQWDSLGVYRPVMGSHTPEELIEVGEEEDEE